MRRTTKMLQGFPSIAEFPEAEAQVGASPRIRHPSVTGNHHRKLNTSLPIDTSQLTNPAKPSPQTSSSPRVQKDARRKRRASRGALAPYLGIRSRNLERYSHLHTCTPRSLHLGLASLIVLAWLQLTCSLT